MHNSIPTEIVNTVLSELKIGLTLIDTTGKVIYFNHLGGELLGWDPNLPENNSILSCHKNESKPKVLDKLNQPATIEWHRVIKTQGRCIENAYSPINIPGQFTGAMIITKDVTERELYLERIKKNSETDPLTGLFNRNLFQEVIQGYINESKPFGLAMLDISGLKYINDHFGHEEGDRILKEAAASIRSSIRDTDFAFRFGGDEFLILTTAKEPVLKMIEARIKSQNKIPTEHTPAVLNISFGYATSFEEKSMEAVLALADQRMYRDKQTFYLGAGKFFKGK
ncbi:PAS domain S-box/diguanylate cyclase (GGDEF) domain-containing protein [Desulfitobacterium dichloroeliminans LMG P-21439]|uniref:PAS domain S-box/diguanylate cyclase (GGDEF) domain-containing protein n=1 Tax=Desulfitobacterium dichloroeliminans (strain LMG P-21439 / DCA1) TaxID=871963 RepID=L0F5I8_DESDL|nr:GGDEF domain-containing protein [Desulfitobacterium dichloroeliminans]AGA68310.1 PAS domain S-box/diguanylate cyclase (GGDEF) domain-containing protein [Desulfitobacterium dichloroeliminans LMG P-21439]